MNIRTMNCLRKDSCVSLSNFSADLKKRRDERRGTIITFEPLEVCEL
jgi:hypothetical protein